MRAQTSLRSLGSGLVMLFFLRLSNKLLKYPNFSYNKQDTPKSRGLTVEVLDIKRDIETLCDRLGKTQDYL